MASPKASAPITGFFFCLAFITKAAYTVFYHTLRLEIVNPQYGRGLDKKMNVVYAFWHAKTFPLLPYFTGRPIAVLTLLDWKNFFYDKLCLLFGYRTVPVSSEAGATRCLIRSLRDGLSVGLAVDGPAGPRGVVRPGAAFLSRVSGKPVVAFQVSMEKSFFLKNRWDHYEIPYPFSKVTIKLSEPFFVTSENEAMLSSVLKAKLGNIG